MKKYHAVVFDLDDTLYPEREYVLSGFRAVAAWAESRFGISPEQTYLEMLQIFLHKDRSRVFDHWLLMHGRQTPENIQQMVRVYREHDPVLHAFPEILAILKMLKGRCRLALLSDGYLSVQKKKFAALQISEYFDVALFSDEWGRDAWKPNPMIFRMLLEKLNVGGPEAVYIADNPLKDFSGARRVGMETIRLRLPGGVYEKEAAAQRSEDADVEFTTFQELNEFLLGSNS